MVVGPDFVTNPRPGEGDEIDALLRAAFGGGEEAALVRRLRAEGAMWHELVVPWGGPIVGYAALSRMQAPEGWACLAPLAVLPAAQRGALAPEPRLKRHYRIGTRLLEYLRGIMSIRAPEFQAQCPAAVVVLGEPAYYERFGFSRTRAARLVSPYPRSHMLLLAPGDDVPEAELVYPDAFGASA